MAEVVARITDVEESNGRYKILLDRTEDPKVLTTIYEEKGREAGQLKVLLAQDPNKQLKIRYTPKDDKPNPHGGFYHDRYYEGAEVLAKPPPEPVDDGITRVVERQRPLEPAEAWRIALSVGTERAATLLAHEDTLDFPAFWALSYEIASRVFLTKPPHPSSLEPLPGGGETVTFGDPGPEAPPIPFDDGIPFMHTINEMGY